MLISIWSPAFSASLPPAAGPSTSMPESSRGLVLGLCLKGRTEIPGQMGVPLVTYPYLSERGLDCPSGRTDFGTTPPQRTKKFPGPHCT